MAQTIERISPLRKSSDRRGDAGARVGSKRSGWANLDGQRVIAAPSVERIEQPAHLQIGKRELIGEPSGEERAAVTNSRQPADDLDSRSSQNVKVERRVLGRADELRRRQPPGALEIVDLIVTLAPDAGGFHPPEHIAAAVVARQPHVLADRERHGSPRALDLIGELHAGGRGTHDKHPARRQPLRIAIVECREAFDVLRHRLTHLRHARDVCGTARQHHAAAADLAVVGRDVVATIDAPDGGDARVGAHGR